MIYDEIYNFCKVRNHGNCYKNGEEITPRVKFLLDLLKKEGIEYELDAFEVENRWSNWFDDEDDDYAEWRKRHKERTSKKLFKGTSFFDLGERFFEDLNPDDISKEDDEKEGIEETEKTGRGYNDRRRKMERDKKKGEEKLYTDDPEEKEEIEEDPKKREQKKSKKNILYNIILRGNSDKMVIAHHDVQNASIDNSNDNSCSVINAIAVKKLRPNVHVVLVDCEECGGLGSDRLGKQIKEGKFGHISWVLNFELTGKGGKNFFIGNYPGPLNNKIIELFDPPVCNTPFNDAITIRRHGIDSTVINPLPILPEGETSNVKTKEGKYLDWNMVHNCHSPVDNVASIDPKDMEEFVEEVVLKILDS